MLTTGLIGSQRLRQRSAPIGIAVFDACQRLQASLRVTQQVSIALCERTDLGELPLEEATYLTLLELARGDTKALRCAALESLSNPSQADDPRSRELAEVLVAADDPAVALLGLNLLLIPHMQGRVASTSAHPTRYTAEHDTSDRHRRGRLRAEFGAALDWGDGVEG